MATITVGEAVEPVAALEAVTPIDDLVADHGDDFDEMAELDELQGDNFDLSEVNRQFEAEELATYLVENYRESGILDSHSAYSDLVNLLVR